VGIPDPVPATSRAHTYADVKADRLIISVEDAKRWLVDGGRSAKGRDPEER
jgi:hypothetical protein